ncbi:MAG: 16S rRNA (guanine(966)-N(2))-methyltransferase RsmD [Hydrotalea sp.]|nr:16S rRNA (guanine(966)-N(2))-methyltransferase RsmD [Hydrotalea sp.]
MAVKILSGNFKGRTLQTPEGLGTRPTGVLARKMMFDMLLTDKKWGRDLSGARVIDICAGAGLLGLEAMSRGAEKILLIEHQPDAVAAIKENIARLRVENGATIVPQKLPGAFGFIPSEFMPSEVIFADPPYDRDDLLAAIINGVAEKKLLAQNGFFIIQTKPKIDLSCPPEFKIIDDRRRGNAHVWFLQWSK